MTKNLRLVLFMLAATVFNIAATAISFIILMLLYTALLVPHMPAESAFFGLPLLFTASIILSFFAYQKLLKRYLHKLQLPGQD